MSWFSGILVYVMIWWVVFFTTLPWGVKVPDQAEPGHAPSAPSNPMLWRKALITTIISAVVWVGAYYLIESDMLSFRQN